MGQTSLKRKNEKIHHEAHEELQGAFHAPKRLVRETHPTASILFFVRFVLFVVR